MANKYDLIKYAEFKQEELREFVLKYNMPFYLTSAKNGQNVEIAFKTLTKRMIKPQDFRSRTPSDVEIIHPKQLFGGKDGKVVKALDKIFDDFSHVFDRPEDAMPVIRKQCEIAGLDIQNPSREAVLRLIERFAKIEKTLMIRDRVQANYEKRLKWISEYLPEE